MPAPRKQIDLGDTLSALGGELVQAAARPSLLRYRPHEKQLDFHMDQHKLRLLLGGNRSGKSVAGCAEGLYHARGVHPYREVAPAPNFGRVHGTDFPSGIGKVLLPLYQQWTPPSMLQNGSWEDSYSTQTRTLTLANKSTIEFMSYDQEVQKFAGASRHWEHFDEEPPLSIYDESRARLVDTDGPWWMTLTPVLGLDYIYDSVYMPAKNGSELYGLTEVEMSENSHLSRTAIAEYLDSLSPEMREVRSQGRFVQVTGSVFPDFNRELHILHPDQFTLKPEHRVYVSIDEGWRDETAVLWHAVDENDTVVTFDELYINQTLIRDTAARIKSINARWGISRPYIYVGDPAMKQTNAITGTSKVMEFARNGIPVAVEGINRDVDFGVQRMTEYLRPSVAGAPSWYIVGASCPNLARQLETNRWQRRASRDAELTLNKLHKIQDKDNHATDSARFFFVLMPQLGPRSRVEGDRIQLGRFSDTLGAKQFASRRDPGPRRDAWAYTAIDDGEFD